MAHFTCEHGSKYHIFGRGGRENLLRGCQDLNHDSSAETLDAVTDNSCSKKGTHTHDESCAPVPSALTGSSQLPSASFLRLQSCPMHSLPIVSDHSTADNVHLPISIAEPFSESAEVFRALARDVLVEVFRSHVGALLVRNTYLYDIYHIYILCFVTFICRCLQYLLMLIKDKSC